jgi:hypothetical protein
VTRATGLLVALSAAEQDLFDALVELGVPSDAARLYQQSFEACQAIVAVRTGGRSVDIVRVLQASAGATATQLPSDARAVERQAADRPAETGARGSRPTGERPGRGDRTRGAAGRR